MRHEDVAIGVDIGGTKIAAGIVTSPGGAVRGRRLLPTRPERGGRAVLDDALGVTRDLLAEADAVCLSSLIRRTRGCLCRGRSVDAHQYQYERHAPNEDNHRLSHFHKGFRSKSPVLPYGR